MWVQTQAPLQCEGKRCYTCCDCMCETEESIGEDAKEKRQLRREIMQAAAPEQKEKMIPRIRRPGLIAGACVKCTPDFPLPNSLLILPFQITLVSHV